MTGSSVAAVVPNGVFQNEDFLRSFGDYIA
jgi:hypothetical protein